VGDGQLEQLQRFVVDAIRGGASPDEPHHVRESARGMTPAERVEVYREQFRLRHLKNLADDYPTLAWAIGGADAFAALATDYLLAHPPRTWDLQRLGADMPPFVETHAKWGSRARACDAARLDWAFMEIFDAPDGPPFDTSVLANTPEDRWPEARIELLPALRVVAMQSPLQDVRDALRSGKQPGEPPQAETRVVVWRDKACFVRHVAIDSGAFDLLAHLRAGDPLGPACEAAARTAGEDATRFGEHVGAWFAQWTANAWIARVRL
jgi:Putative DNA-binding domain/NGO1945 C-terminal domain